MSEETKPGIAKKAIKFAKDGWSNLITGLNATDTSKKRHTRHKPDGLITDQELESLYAEDGLAARIVDLLVDDMFREGWEYDFPTLEELKAEKIIDQYKDVMEAIGAYQKCAEAIKWGRLYGGSLILIGVTDGSTPDKPLNPKKIKTIENLKVIDRTDVDFQKIEFQTDPLKPRYGLPEYYSIKFDVGPNAQAETRVHYSRIIEIHGTSLPNGATTFTSEQRYWGLSVLQRVEDHLRTLGSSLGSIDQLLQEMSVGKYKIKDLAVLLSSTEGKAAIQRRVEISDLTRSVFRSQYLDSAEDYSRDEIAFTGVPEILYIIFMLISADTGYPITRLFGVSPAGMNATGESDMRNYYDAVRSKQTFQLQPILLRLVKIISEWLGIDEPYINFAPLQTMNEKERAELDRQKADTEQVKATTYKTYIDAGILEPYEARFLEFGDTLDKIPVPEDLLPPVETVEELTPPPPSGENDNPGEGNPEGEEPTGEKSGKEHEEDDPEGEEENPEGGKKPDEEADKKKASPKKTARGRQAK
jgi:phage-related protein (TIGR01555 family)